MQYKYSDRNVDNFHEFVITRLNSSDIEHWKYILSWLKQQCFVHECILYESTSIIYQKRLFNKSFYTKTFQ